MADDKDLQDQFILCSLPLILDRGLLAVLLDSTSDVQRDRLWRSLRSLSFIHTYGDDKLVFHPLVRLLLLMRLTPEVINRSYYQCHKRLEDHFEGREAQDGGEAILLYHWLLTAPLNDQQKLICWSGLDFCYSHLPHGIYEEDIKVALDHMVKLGDRQVNAQAHMQLGGGVGGAIQPSPGGTSSARQGPVSSGLVTSGTVATPGVPLPLPSPLTRHLPASPMSGLPTSPLPKRGILNTQLLANMRRFFAGRQARRPGNRNLLLVRNIVGVILSLIACTFIQSTIGVMATSFVTSLFSSATPTHTLISNPPGPDLRQPNEYGIGVSLRSNGEYIGLSDGSYPFDVAGRPDILHKTQASAALLRNDSKGATTFWKDAITSDGPDGNNEPNDAEVQIYLENQKYINSCIGVVVATDLSPNSGSGVTNGRDELQGAYLVQRIQNDSPSPLKICLLIANMGSDAHDANSVAQQIVKAVPKYRIKVGYQGNDVEVVIRSFIITCFVVDALSAVI